MALEAWQEPVYAGLRDAYLRRQLGHATLLTGPAKIGKRAIADALAAFILCQDRNNGVACNQCRACELRMAGSHADLRVVGFELNKEGTKLRSEIVIEQLRDVNTSLTLTAQHGGAQIVIVDPADRINNAAANALLKTLEEPFEERFIWLLTSNPGMLKQTIRSRCQKVEVGLPTTDVALAWLEASGHQGEAAVTALAAAKGHPVVARDWLDDGTLALRSRIASDLEDLATSRKMPLEIANTWAEGDVALCLSLAADIAVDRAAALTSSAETRTLAQWFDEVNRSRGLLQTPVRPQLILMELLVDWCRRMVPLNRERRT